MPMRRSSLPSAGQSVARGTHLSKYPASSSTPRWRGAQAAPGVRRAAGQPHPWPSRDSSPFDTRAQATSAVSTHDHRDDDHLPPEALTMPAHPTSAAAAGGQVPAVRGPDPAPPARNPLGEMAQRLVDAPYDQQHGRYTYVHTHGWALDTTATAGRTTSRIAVFDEQLWIAADGSGRDQLARLPDQPAGGPLRWSTPRPGAASTEDFPAGGRARSLPQPPSADPDALAAQLNTIQPRANGPQSVVRAVADIYRDIAPGTPVRAAMLRLLASISAVTYRGHVTDRAGRNGFAVSVDSDVRDTLVFDEHTGVLLAFEAVLLTQPSRLDVGPGAIRESVLYLDYAHTDQLGALPPAVSARADSNGDTARAAGRISRRRRSAFPAGLLGGADVEPQSQPFRM